MTAPYHQHDFLETLKAAPPNQNKIFASLDVQSLFTSVHVVSPIQLISDHVQYCSKDTPSLDIPKDHLHKLLKMCTAEAPFACPQSVMYCQIDRVATENQLGALFANFSMGSIESTIVKNLRPSHLYLFFI